MNTKPTLLSLIFFLMISMSYAQKKGDPINMIEGKAHIAKYHSHDELNNMSKGDLLTLYTERIQVLIKILPNIAFSTKPGVTMASLGIPESKDNVKALEESREAFDDYFDSTIAFQKKILPYSNSQDLIAAVLFYEETLKSLHTYNEFKVD